MKKQKKSFKEFYKNSVFSKGEFYIKISLIFLLCSIFLVVFFTQNGSLFFEFYPYADKFQNYDFQVHFIDVGNGDAMLIKFPNNQTMMIDTGDDYYENKVVSYTKQYLWSEGLNKIDYLVLTHSDSDHVGGAKAILENFKVKSIYRPKIYSKSEENYLLNKENYYIDDSEIYDEVITTAYKKKCNIIFNEAGLTFSIKGCKVEFLAPLYDNYSISNNYSAVIKMTYQTKVFLFMGDAEKSVENELIEKYDDDLKADVLKVGHHGSYTSTSLDFLYKVMPEYSILSCSSKSDYYPHKDVVENLKSINSKLLNTGIRGSFAISVANNEIVYANAEKSSNHLALIFTIFMLVVFIIWENPFKRFKPLINRINND